MKRRKASGLLFLLAVLCVLCVCSVQATESGVVVIPEGTKKIKMNEFRYRSDITQVILPDSVKTIEYGAFQGCENLTEINITDSVTTIGARAFEDCWALQKVGTVEAVEQVGSQAFLNCMNLQQLNFTKKLTNLGMEAFRGCTALKQLGTVSGVESLGDAAFQECSSLQYIGELPLLREIPVQAFKGCKALREFSIPDAVTFLGREAFEGCSALTELVLPKGLITLEMDVFKGTTKLEKIENYPDPAFYDRYKTNTVASNQWINPATCLEAQSQRILEQSKTIAGSITDPYEKAQAICEWVVGNIRYDYDYFRGYKSDTAVSPEEVLDTRLTVCDGYARLTNALLQAQGIPAIRVSGRANGESGWDNHAWNEIFVDGRWVLVDNTWGMEYFDCGKAQFSFGHVTESRIEEGAAQNIPSDWAQSLLMESMGEGLVPDDMQSNYKAAITREEFCRLMVTLVEQATGKSITNYLAQKGLTASEPFADTDSPAVAAAYTLGIISGRSATTFDPNSSINRQEAAVMLTAAGKVLGLTAAGGNASFADGAQIDSWAQNGVQFVVGRNIMSGTGNNQFSPKATYNREQAMITTLRLFQNAAA